MSHYPFNSDFDTPSRLFGGVTRQSSTRRLHQVARPYSRPASYTGPSVSIQNGNANVASGSAAQGRMGESTQPPSIFTRPLPNSISTSTIASGMTRSSSDPSLSHRQSSGGILSGFKSMFSRPLQWLATPSKGTRREQDVEDQESPVVQRRQNGGGDSLMRTESRTGQMLPPLPPNVTMSLRNRPPSSTNFSRPLHTVRSLPHLDPPGTIFNSPSSGRSSGVLTRSRRVNVDETEEDEAEEKETWSPWKDQQRRASPRLTPARSTTPLRRGSVQDRPLPSQSPFRPSRSPSQRANGSGLYRSNTTANTTSFARAGSVMSDVSMGKDSIKSPRKPGSTLFSHREDAMSVDGDRAEGSMGFFAKERWENGSARASPTRSGPAIRRGQLVWDSEKGFVRESELHQDRNARPVGKNEAEKILFALEAQREGPLKSVSSPSLHGHSLPPELIGASSRTLRQAISVPLATAMAGDTARGRRDKERAENKTSLMISPYGRRRQVDEDARHERRATRERDEEYRPSSERQPSQSEHSSRDDTDYSMHSESEVEARPPRRSRRHKRRETTPEQTTPKARKTGKGKAAGESARKQDSPTKSRRSKRHAETPSSPAPPEVDKSVPPVPSVPTITETAPSPDAKSSTYAPRVEGESSRESSSLRAKSSVSKRTHGASASLTNSRATSPTSTGRYSAREEDLPPMDELEAPKIPFNSFSGVSFALDKPAPKPETPPPVPSGGSLASRIGPPKSESSNLGVPRISSGPLSRINSSRPRASSPLASSSIVAAPESPPSDPPAPAVPPSGGIFPLASSSTGSTTPTKPPPSSLFAGIGSGEPKKSLGAGLGKPPAESSAVPDFFGKKSQPASGTVTPSTQPFNFGAAAEAANAPPTVEAPKTNGSTPFSFGAPSGAKPEETKTAAPAPSKSPIWFGAPAEASKPAFSFGQPSTSTLAEKPAEPPKPFSGFTFGQPAASSPAPPAEKSIGTNGTSTGFSFNKPAEAAPAEPAKTPFSFGAASTPAAEPAKPSFSFGAPSAETKSTPEPAKPTGFAFGATAAPAPSAAAPASGSFTFGKPAEPAPTPSTFTFGAQANGTTGNENNGQGSTGFVGFGNSTGQANGTNTFGSTASPGFAFGSNTATNTSFGAAPTPPPDSFGAPATPSNAFGSAPASAPASTGSGFNFSFSAPSPVQTNGAAPSPSFGFGQQPSPSTPSNPGTFQFGSGTPQSSASTPFTFGAGASGGTPQSQGNQPFVFGSGGMNGQPQPPRFGSPGPSQDSPSGGFNMGMEPSSPSGRKIKPLRRGAVKR